MIPAPPPAYGLRHSFAAKPHHSVNDHGLLLWITAGNGNNILNRLVDRWLFLHLMFMVSHFVNLL